MNRLTVILAFLASLGAMSALSTHPVGAQPAKGAPAAFERVREVTNDRFKDMRLSGDPDQDFATMLLGHYENIIFLAKTQLEFGGDRELRQSAQKILDEQQKQIDAIKQWQARTRQPNYQAQPNQTPSGAGPLDQRAQASPPAQAAPAQTMAPPSAPAPPASAANTPLVSGTVEKVDAAAGKITIDHGASPTLNMEGMTMVFRAGDPAMLKQVKQGDKVRFSAERVNGQLTVTRIQKGR